MTPPVSQASEARARLPIGLLIGVLALVAVLLLPLPADLPVAGHRMLAILAFAVVVWISEASPTAHREAEHSPKAHRG